MLLVVTAVAALSGPTGHSRRAAPLPARREGQLSRMQNVEGWRGNNGRWRKYEEIKECAAGRRSYVPVGDFFNLETPDPIMDSTLGVRILFAIIVGTLVSFNSLAVDTGADSLQRGAAFASTPTRRRRRRHRRNAGGLQPPVPRRVQDRVRDRDRFIETAPRDAVAVLRRERLRGSRKRRRVQRLRRHYLAAVVGRLPGALAADLPCA